MSGPRHVTSRAVLTSTKRELNLLLLLCILQGVFSDITYSVSVVILLLLVITTYPEILIIFLLDGYDVSQTVCRRLSATPARVQF
jgi:hypothetical protein